jgi:hypothetical protein
MVGAGGTLAELAEDTALAPAPLDRSQAMAMIRGLKADRLLAGYRGSPPADRAALAKALVALSRFAAANRGNFTAIDINPVMVLPKGKGLRAVDALIVPASPDKTP